MFDIVLICFYNLDNTSTLLCYCLFFPSDWDPFWNPGALLRSHTSFLALAHPLASCKGSLCHRRLWHQQRLLSPLQGPRCDEMLTSAGSKLRKKPSDAGWDRVCFHFSFNCREGVSSSGDPTLHNHAPGSRISAGSDCDGQVWSGTRCQCSEYTVSLCTRYMKRPPLAFFLRVGWMSMIKCWIFLCCG